MTVSAATTISIQVAPLSSVTSEGVLPDTNTGVWHQLYYVSDPIQIIFASAGSASIIVPD